MEEFIREVNVKGNGVVDFEEFVQALSRSGDVAAERSATDVAIKVRAGGRGPRAFRGVFAWSRGPRHGDDLNQGPHLRLGATFASM